MLHDASLFLDFDGTLVDLAPTPDAVVVEPALLALLARLDVALEGRLAIVSGRSVAQIDALLGIDALAVGGSHGVELRRRDGQANAPGRAAALDRAAAEMRALGEQFPQVVVEEKAHGVGLHFRLAPEAEAACVALAEGLAARSGLALQPGKMMIELRTPGADKGAAIEAFMAEPPMHGTRPVFIGDDLTDEAGFAAVARAGGAGVLIGEGRETAARYGLPDVPAALAWLAAAAEALA